MEALRARGGNKPGAAATTHAGPGAPRARDGGEGRAPEGHEQLKELIEGYKGFGILSLIRALMFRGCRSFVLAIIGIVLLVGQWTGPVGFIAFKVTAEDSELCEGGAGVWAKCVVASVAMIYFARLSLAALAHKQRRPQEFEDYCMPKWWGMYRHLDLIATSLLYDTFIFLANLFVVFQDRSVSDMIVDVLALEFFTMIDDQFKAAVIEYDSTFLYDVVLVRGKPTELPGPRRIEAGEYQARATPATVLIPPLTEALFKPGDFMEADYRRDEGVFDPAGDPTSCCDVAGGVVCFPVKVVLLVVRAVCRVGGPLLAFVMIFYGPVCLGAPTNVPG